MAYLEENLVYHGRSEERMSEIAPSSIALSVWSPPYFVGKEYEKGETYESWQHMLRTIIENHFRVLKPGAFMVVNSADILCFKDDKIPRFQAANAANHRSPVTRMMVVEAKKTHPSFNRHELAALLGCSEQTIDRRLNGNNIRGGKYEPQTRVKLVGAALEEYAYNAGLYLYDHRIWAKDPSWANSKWTTSTLKAVSEFEDIYVFWKPGEYVVNRQRLAPDDWREWGYRGVWRIKSVRKNDDHEAKFPVELASRIIKLYSDQGDTVLDPFMGSGTTGVAAVLSGRKFIGIEKEKIYVDLANQTIRRLLEQKAQ